MSFATRAMNLSLGERIEVFSFVGLGMILIVIGYLIADQDVQQWGVLLMMLGLVFLLSYREFIGSRVLIPGQMLEAYEQVVKLISAASNFLYIVDLYPSETTINAIICAPDNIPVKFLTGRYKDEKQAAQFEAVAIRTMQLYPNIQIRYAPKDLFHDRFLFTEPHGWALGQSIKDIGNKLGTINALTIEATKQAVQVFEDGWNRSTLLN